MSTWQLTIETHYSSTAYWNKYIQSVYVVSKSGKGEGVEAKHKQNHHMPSEAHRTSEQQIQMGRRNPKACFL